ncbi:TetR/AcrR family transcriptional regulator C-terminal domain-containing protein [Saccharothrix obliqua]|uniref:TetR/AcrR family transcriptional regulator C-terminal domain-containing protein n=1 Tax=Saccharothrix obliqua TaxID=2861747 RepID=UPI001C5ED0AE|nr:TetR/AcrR family transcriptional regulator C-terminal domain-containing protein [Saccharothrix obliqua]MBW4718254.1 TetR/AcrR family transcriptional regulator [Saccharothrix obliqua]
MVVFAGQGDARRSISLLWRVAEGGAPRPGLSVDAVVDAAIAVADEQGMGALSMRAVGERLGRTAMALYTYVPNKAELVDLMYDKVLGELPSAYPLDDGWRPALAAWAGDVRAFYLWHPWVLQVSQARPVLGPNEFTMLETLLGILRETGLSAVVLRGVVGAVGQFVRGMAGVIADARRAARETGVSDEEWWYARTPVLAEYAAELSERFPLSAWIGEVEPPAADECTPYLEREAERNFAIGLEVLLDGIEAAVARSAEGGGTDS